MKRRSGSRSRAEQQLQVLMDKARKMEQGGDLEGLLITELRELEKLIYEEAVAERESASAACEADFPPPVCRQCDAQATMRKSGYRPRTIRTLAGEVHYERTVYECPVCRCSFSWRDWEMGAFVGERLTRGLVRKVAYASALGSYSTAHQMLGEFCAVPVSRAEFARVVDQEGDRLEHRQRRREELYLRSVSPQSPAPAPEKRCERLVLEADATCVLTVAGEEHKSVYCGVAFDLADRGRDAGKRPFLAHKRYTASAEDMADFGQRLKALAHRLGLRQSAQVCFLADGAHCLWRWAKEHLPPNARLIQDFWHVMEHLAGLAQDMFGQAWPEHLARWEQLLRASRVADIIAELKRSALKRRGQVQKRLKQEIGYLENGRERMDYARYQQEGWPIGSGAVEGACKHLIKERFCVTGAHWRRDNISKLLAIRQSIFNDEWESDWQHRRVAA
ncbi:ISKra4 family transposase [Candidatus Sumerlaeota bacterium]